MPRPIPLAVASAAVPFLLCSTALAQCGLDWQPGVGTAGPNGTVFAARFAANGDLYAAGTFSHADFAKTTGVARWDGTTWHGLGSGLVGQTLDLLEHSSGDWIAGGQFGLPAVPGLCNLARWDGTSWTVFGGGANSRVEAVLEVSGGDIVAAGQFTVIGGVTANRIARWNGTSWSPLGPGVGGSIYAVAEMPNGDLVVGGNLITGGVPHGLMRWDGSTWSVVAGSQPGAYTLAVLQNGDVLAGGLMDYTTPTGPVTFERLVRWNGTQVTPIATPFQSITSLAVLPNGDVLATSSQAAANQSSVARWNGTTWTTMSAGAPASANCSAIGPNGRIAIGGLGNGVGFDRLGAAREWNGTQWVALGGPVPPQVTALQTGANGEVYAGGTFTSFQGIAANRLLRFANGSWSAVGGGVGGRVTALTTAPNGDLLVGGEFTTAGGGPANRIARWNGSSWTSLGSGLAVAPTSLAVTQSGEVFAAVPGASTLLFRFDGVAWTQLTTPTLGLQARLLALPDGSLLMSGVFANLVHYQNGVFSYLPCPYVGETQPMSLDPNGRLVVGVGSYIARRDGATWTLLADSTGSIGNLLSFGQALAFAFLPNGDLVTVGTYVVQGQTVGIWKFDGTAWSIVDIGTQAGTPSRVAVAATGDLFVAGEFVGAGNETSVRFAHATPTCPAAVASSGTGCTGAGGPLSLQANGLPWAGGTFAATATGLASPLALRTVGDPSPASPLPLGAPGCSLYVLPFAVDVLLPVAGSAAAGFTIPRQANLAGLVFHTQVVGIELTPTGDLMRLTSTNALALSVGAL